MRLRHITMLASLSLVSSFALGQGNGTLEVLAPGYSWRNSEYTISHVYVDEVAGTTQDIQMRYDLSGFSNVTDVEIFTNLNRRDLAAKDKDGDGEHDGIIPVDGNTITDSAADSDPMTGHYYAAYNMSDGDADGTWELTIPANRTGAYRLTARFKVSDPIPANDNNPNNWIWLNVRDHAIVVVPTTARDIRMYEVNVFNIEASGTTLGTRSTWEDMIDAPGAIHTDPNRVNQWNLQNYLTDLGVNWLWFQPYHPYGEEGRHLSAQNIIDRDPNQAGATTLIRTLGQFTEDVNYPFALGSPYAVKNFFEIDPRTSANYDPADDLATQREKARQSFVNFVDEADSLGINLMPDAAFNHAAWDMELGGAGIGSLKNGYQFWPNTWMDAQLASGWAETDLVHDRELRVFSRAGDYRLRAFFYNDFFNNNIAPGPDRTDFGKWLDVVDIFYGRYDALVGAQDGSEASRRNNEGDWFDYTTYEFNGTDGGSFDPFTRATWRYFAQYAPYWISQSRPAGENRNSTPSDGTLEERYEFDARGVDGLRCDFGQGLPPQAWEYIINVARSHKWSFVFMAESLDGGAVTYRSARHFDILNENIIFAIKGADQNPAGLRTAFRETYENRRNSYGQAMILLNLISHDEDSYDDPFVALAYYLAHASMDGAPMIFPGQELGISETYGYDLYERNFGKFVPHFKTWNSMMPIYSDTDFGLDQIFHVFAAANRARANSPALTSPNRWFLEGDGFNNFIHSVAKYESENVSPAQQDAVLAFANLDRNSAQSDNYVIPSGLADRLGLANGRTYNVKNLAAYTAQDPTRNDQWLWGDANNGEGFTRDQLVNTGFFVSLDGVPASVAGWTTNPFEAQYLKIYDVTAPPAPNPETNYYALGTEGTFTWDPATAGFDPDHDVITDYQITIRDSQGNVLLTDTVSAGTSSYTFTGTAGETYYAELAAVSVAGISSSSPGTSDAGDPNPASSTTPVILLDPSEDQDGDGITNAEEDTNGTDPLVSDLPFEICDIDYDGTQAVISFRARAGNYYTLESSLTMEAGTWQDEDEAEVNDVLADQSGMMEFTDTNPAEPKKFYRIRQASAPE